MSKPAKNVKLSPDALSPAGFSAVPPSVWESLVPQFDPLVFGDRPHPCLLLHGGEAQVRREIARFLASRIVGSLGPSHADHLGASHPDIIWICSGDERSISAEVMRTALGRMQLTSAAGARRVTIIDGLEALTDQAANALLKTVEEPTDAMVFILLAERLDATLPTLRSRVAKLAVPLPTNQEALVTLRSHGVSEKDAAHYLSYADGRPFRALSRIENLGNDFIGDIEKIVADLDSGRLDRRQLWSFADKYTKSEKQWEEATGAVVSWLRHQLDHLLGMGPEGDRSKTVSFGGSWERASHALELALRLSEQSSRSNLEKRYALVRLFLAIGHTWR